MGLLSVEVSTNYFASLLEHEFGHQPCNWKFISGWKMIKFVVQLKCKCLHFFVLFILLNKNLKIFNRREKIFDLKNIINRSKNYEGLVDYGQVRNFWLLSLICWGWSIHLNRQKTSSMENSSNRFFKIFGVTSKFYMTDSWWLWMKMYNYYA